MLDYLIKDVFVLIDLIIRVMKQTVENLQKLLLSTK